METYVINAQPRDITGRKVRQLRTEGRVPVVLYGHGTKPRNLSVARGDLEKIYRQAGGSSVVKVHLPEGEQNVLIQDIQDDPTTGLHLHADFYQVRMDEKIKATVPLEFEGTPPAVRELDGVLLTNLTELEVECLPGDLPHEIKVDVESLATFEDAITVADLKLPPGVEVHNEPETNVASVSPPRTEAELEELEEAPEELDAEAIEEVGKEGEAEGEAGEGEGEDKTEGAEAKAEGGKEESDKKD